ncbi:putative aldehyde dehydrogenase family protein [Lyophyllum shimeji]|uniref:Aldehyde dehydrogenase n=1 Tax=Lyophyllum shimeji TaxID=47721 RepID=A0A9P3UU58_LYOSH|nr:putative aldehyde dehydrogenase family protein [Lyophyllum shimeji]
MDTSWKKEHRLKEIVDVLGRLGRAWESGSLACDLRITASIESPTYPSLSPHATMKATPVDEIPKIRAALRENFRKGITRPLSWRRHQLLQLARMMQENADALAESLALDLGRPRMEAYFAEVGAVMDRAIICAQKLEEWTKPESVDVPDWQKSWSPTIHKASKGTVLIISPWNYPLILTLQPLYGAISAGCCAVIKPSELAANYAALLAQLVPKYLDHSTYRVVLGAVPETTKLLELQWDHIFYTGNGRIARIIATAAAKHLTPLTLELGGKSPVIVDGTFDIGLAAKRILWGKINNAGQICVAPDHVLVLREKQEELAAAFKAAYDLFYPEGALNSTSISRIVSDAHFERLKGLLERTKGEIVFGGKTNVKRGFEPTIVKNVAEGDSLLEEEIFGPILPLVPVDSVQEAIEFVNSRDHPLVLYVFTEDPKTKKAIIEETMSGNLVFNDTFQQLSVNELPFGGVGESGYGRQVLKYSYENFTYDRACIDVPKSAEPTLELRYPPYTEEKLAFFSAPLKAQIPELSLVNGNGTTH